MTASATPFEGAVIAPYEASRADESAQALRERFDRLGYLYLPGAVPLELTQPLLKALLACVEPSLRWDEARRAPVLCGEPFFESDETWDAIYPDIQALESLHGIFHAPELLRLMQQVAGERVFVYPMKMARIATPGKLGFETPPHQDAYSHHAGPTMAGIWIALHDVDERMGRLALLPGSHTRGVRAVHEARGVGGVQCEIFPDETLWHVANVGAGDVIIFHSQTVHRAEPNTHECSARLSVDTRFCDYGAPVFSTNLEPHHGWRIPRLDWDYVYRDWASRELCYYWRDYPALF
ncbi:MAG: phytanoyl-CoA dioxygenase family protein [Halieaceae bacterium]|jgi:hypothetical protein|nr:phytanoyl-CoA dioxygenase family protein [Halieaceae bacterium]